MRVGAFRAATDGAGVATIDVPAGTYEVSAWKAGYEAAVTRVEESGSTNIARACRRCRTEGMFEQILLGAAGRRGGVGRTAEKQPLSAREDEISSDASRNVRLAPGLVAVNGNLHPDGEGILCHAEPHELIRTAALDHPADYLAVRPFQIEVKPQMGVDHLPFHESPLQLYRSAHIKLCRECVMRRYRH